jgi:alkanesulfonate monooxygenase SsuD/methylene tetrahydromethanopterin reductase-like flavin-dependent oxidoreductase (luciferase family)
MEIGIALPQMAPGYAPGTTVEWARRVDQGPFSSISAGERVTFSNPEMVASLGACAAVTSRVRVFANLWVLPTHSMAMVAQQVNTLDQLSGGRLAVAVGVGAREDDYRALGSPFTGRHGRLDEQVHELRRLLAGEPAFPGADPVGPPPTRAGGPEILAGALGPKAMRRAAQWADGISGFSLSARAEEIAATNALADQCWREADRGTPRKVSGTFFAFGVDDPLATLRAFAARYLGFLGDELAEALAADVRCASPEALVETLDGAEAAGCDEFILVPGTVDVRALDAVAEVVAARQASAAGRRRTDR